MPILHSTSKKYEHFQDILSDDELNALFKKFTVIDERVRKLPVLKFFWLMVLSAAEPGNRGSLLLLIGFYLGSIVLLFKDTGSSITSVSKKALSKRLCHVNWYLFRGVYNHLLDTYKDIIGAKEVQFLKRFKDAFAIDGSVIAVCKKLEPIFKSVHKGHASLKLNVKFSLTLKVLTKLQVSMGKRHDSRFRCVTKASNLLYLCDLGYWSFKLLQRIIDAGSYFVFRLKSSCDPLITGVKNTELTHLIGKRLSEINELLKEQSQLDIIVRLSKAKNPKFNADIRLIGILYEGQWRFYITNIFDAALRPELIYELYALRWQVEIYFNLIKNVLNLKHIVSKTKNGMMIEIYSALILHVLTQIFIALAAKKACKSIHDFSFERSFKLVKGFLLANISLFFQDSLKALDKIFSTLILVLSRMGLKQKKSTSELLNFDFSP